MPAATPPPLPTPPPPPVVPAVKPAPAATKEPPAALGRMSLIPQSALAALKRSAAQRSKESGTPANQLSMPINVEFLHAGERRSALVRELSESGALLVTRLDLLPNQKLELELQMPVDAGSLRSESMRVSATVSQALGKGFRVAFSEPSSDFIDRLQSLLAQR